MLNHAVDYRRYLKSVLADICSKNPAYSIRAFARQVGISPSHFSRVINGEKNISSEMALKIATELDLNEQDTEHFLDMVSVETADDHTKKLLIERLRSRTAGQGAPKQTTLEMEMFRVISDWYYLPLYELTKAKNFQSDPQWIAKKLGLTLVEVKAALDRLVAVRLIEIDENGVIKPLNADGVQTTDDVPSIAIKKHHEQMARKSVDAIKTQDVHEREFQSVHFAFNKKNLPAAKKMIREFVQRFEEEFKPQPGDDVYQLSVQFFRLTNKMSD